MNYSGISLSEAKKYVFVKSLKFSISPKKLNYADWYHSFELLYRSISNIGDMPNQNLDFVKAKIKDAALTSFRNYNANLPRRLSNDEVAKFF